MQDTRAMKRSEKMEGPRSYFPKAGQTFAYPENSY